MSTGVGSALDEVKELMVSNVEPPTARVEQRRLQVHEGWKRKLMNAEHLEPRQRHYCMNDKVPVKTVTAVLHACEDVQQASCGDTEEPPGECGCRGVAQTGCKYDPGVGNRYDVMPRPLLNRRIW